LARGGVRGGAIEETSDLVVNELGSIARKVKDGAISVERGSKQMIDMFFFICIGGAVVAIETAGCGSISGGLCVLGVVKEAVRVNARVAVVRTKLAIETRALVRNPL
jgi:hypothetical protein